MKMPWLAVLLNVVPLGIGYIYLERDERFYATFLAGVGATLALSMAAILEWFDCGISSRGQRCPDADEMALITGVWALLFLLAVYTVQDAWRLALRHNEKVASQSGPNKNGQSP